jgi:hypothetical protein
MIYLNVIGLLHLNNETSAVFSAADGIDFNSSSRTSKRELIVGHYCKGGLENKAFQDSHR